MSIVPVAEVLKDASWNMFVQFWCEFFKYAILFEARCAAAVLGQFRKKVAVVGCSLRCGAGLGSFEEHFRCEVFKIVIEIAHFPLVPMFAP